MLSLIGGIIILLVGALIAFVGSLIGSFGGMVPGSSQAGTAVETLGLLGIVNGLLVIVFGVMLYVRPQQHIIWGVLVLILSIVSWFTTLGGFFLGLILALIGGILGIVFKPSPPPMMAPAPMYQPPMPPQ